jgi:hypothetical protein
MVVGGKVVCLSHKPARRARAKMRCGQIHPNPLSSIKKQYVDFLACHIEDLRIDLDIILYIKHTKNMNGSQIPPSKIYF